jgi:hypothetical protein
MVSLTTKIILPDGVKSRYSPEKVLSAYLLHYIKSAAGLLSPENTRVDSE